MNYVHNKPVVVVDPRVCVGDGGGSISIIHFVIIMIILFLYYDDYDDYDIYGIYGMFME